MAQPELWLLQEKIGKQPWKLALYFAKYYGDDAREKARDIAKYMTEQHSRRKYRAVQYVPKRKSK